MSVKISTCIILFVSLFLGLHPITTTSSRCPDHQNSSLWSFKNDLIFESKLSTRLVTWNLSMDCCELSGVECDKAGHVTDLILDQEGISVWNSSHLTRLKSLKTLIFSHNLLSGNFPESLLTLPSLEVLYLSYNNLSGPIRKDIRVVSYNLLLLDLSYNRFQGPLPEFIFKFPSIITLTLSSNNFSGSVPLDEFGKLKNLTQLDLSYNNLTVIANTNESYSFSSHAKLLSLQLASCKMPKVPNLKNQANLIILVLSDNRFEGEIPNWIWNVGNGSLFNLNLSKNKFSSLEKPYTFPSLLRVLDLSSNELKGDIPIPPAGILDVNYSNNKFGSSISSVLWNAVANAGTFSISNSKVTGVIPDLINNASYGINYLDLSSSNLLTGTIPLDGRMQSLESLDLSNNMLSGRIPEQLTSITGLKFLNVSYNRLSGKIPQGGTRFPTFTNLSFEGNKGLCGPPLSKTCGTSNKRM